MLYLTTFFAPIQQIVKLYNTYQQGHAAVIKLRDRHGVRRWSNGRALPTSRPRGRHQIEDVSFDYLPGRPVLKDVDLTSRPVRRSPSWAQTGAGKSTS